MFTKEFDVQGMWDNQELMELAEGIEGEDLQMIEDQEGLGEDIDDIDGLVDEITLLTAKERAGLEASIRPVQLALVKVSQPQG